MRSLKGSSALIGSGSFAPAKDPLCLIPAGIHVAGSNPWFCMKKMTRFGPPAVLGSAPAEAARAIPGNIDVPTVAPKPDASICKDFLRLIIIKENGVKHSTRLIMKKLQQKQYYYNYLCVISSLGILSFEITFLLRSWLRSHIK
jgi:hypothetical protein